MSINPILRSAAVALAALNLAACGGGSDGNAADSGRTLDTADTNAPAKLTTSQDVANATSALGAVVDANSFGASFGGGSFSQPSRAKYQSTENCSDGGSVTYQFDEADFASPPYTVHADFMDCRDGTSLIDGAVALRCDNPNDNCSNGQATLGDNPDALYFEDAEERLTGLLLGRIDYEGVSDSSSFQRTSSRLSGQLDSMPNNAHVSFALGDSGADFESTTTTSQDSVALTVDGPYALAANTDAVSCASGKVAVETLQPLTISNSGDGPVISGQLKFTNADGETAFADFNSDGSVTVTGADGSQQTLSEAELQQRCALN